MAVTEILVCANGSGLLESRLKIALQVAGRLASHIQVVFFQQAENPATVPTYGPTFGYSAQHGLAQSTWDAEAAELARAKALYDRWVAASAVTSATPSEPIAPRTASWLEVAGPITDLFPSYCRACDLIVAGGPGENASSSTLDDEVSKLALLSSGRMTLLAPRAENLASDLFRSVVIAWNDGAAVARTVAQAMPLIARAREVRLFVGEPSPEHVTPCNQILAYLRRKGVRPDVMRSVPALHTVRETLVQQARKLEASLIVMGAYEHSRAQEILLGGTTRYVIQHAGCAVLMVD